MITEDYCSFEIAKLLKEKGFDAEIKTYWSLGFLNEPILEFVKDPYEFDVSNSNCFVGLNDTKYSSTDIVCIAPTLQIAMKWLREVHKLHIGIVRTSKGYCVTIETVPFVVVRYTTSEIVGTTYVDSYEQSCEAAIKYCLENLV